MRSKSYIAVLALAGALLGAPPTVAQEVDCTVKVNTDAVPTTHKDLLVNFADDIRAYLENYNWGGGDASEKVKCTIDIFFKSVSGDNQYVAQAFIGSQRPRFMTDQSTAVLRLMDESWEFTYVKDRPINHSPRMFSDLASFLDFYMFLIMGYDYDTYDELSGTINLQKAFLVANLGMSSGQKSWQRSTTQFSRTQLVADLLDPKFEPVRRASWIYHYCGIDSLSLRPHQAQENMITALEMIGRVRKTVDPRNLAFRAFFDAKHMELAEVFRTYPEESVYDMLVRVDPGNQTAYEAARKKRVVD
jgi:hypothetical protein